MIALLSGVLLVLLHPGFNLRFLAPLALAPLFYFALHQPRAPRRLLFGWLTGVLYWGGVCYWIQMTLQQHGGMGASESWAVFLLFCFAKALQTAVFAWAAPFIARRWWAAPALAALWTLLEWTHSYTGFQWLVLGNVAADWPFAAKLAPFTGVWGLSFALALPAAVLVTRQCWWLALFLPLLAVPPLPAPAPATFTAFAIQPNISEETVWSQESTAALQRHLAALSRPPSPPAFIVWPEVPAPVYDQDRFLSAIAREASAPLLAGVVSHTDHGAPLNSALLLSAEGRFVSRYDKVNLVPFGEFVPWPFGALTAKISTEAGDYAPGSAPVVASALGTFICYESVFPHYIRRFPLAGATVLFNLSNDSWFARSAARDQHFLIVRMRAIENRRWIVRVTNNGITAAIDSVGHVHDLQPSFQELAAPLHFGRGNLVTFYTIAGDYIIVFCSFFLFLFRKPANRRFERT